jgi:hypothetical protein
MTLDDLVRLVREAAGRPVVLDVAPTVYLDDDGATLEPTDEVLPEPADGLVLSLLADRYPGVVFDLPDEFPAFRPADPVPDFVVAQL